MADELNDLYIEVADRYAQKIQGIFASEESLQKIWEKHHSAMPFDRTNHWNTLLQKELEQTWAVYGPVVRAAMSPHDRAQVLAALHYFLDFNLFTQVMLNLQPFRFFYAANDAVNERRTLEAKWAGKQPNPFEAKARMFKNAKVAGELDFNRDLSTLKALKTIEGISPFASFRVSAIGSTPALTDSANLSSLGVGADKFLRLPVPFAAYYLTWEAPPPILRPMPNGSFGAPGLPYTITSKSGGEILNGALFSRKVAYDVFGKLLSYDVTILPRLNSVLVITDAKEETMRSAEVLPTYFHKSGMTLHTGVRTTGI